MTVKNIVGKNVPTDEQRQQLTAQLKELFQTLGTWGVILNQGERGSFLKPRTGGEKYIDLVLQLASEKKVNLDGMPLSDVKADLTVGRAAEEIEHEVAAIHQLATDTRLAGYGEAWQAFLAYYGVLSSMATRDGDLAKRLAPVVEFMSIRRTQSTTKTKTAQEQQPA